MPALSGSRISSYEIVLITCAWLGGCRNMVIVILDLSVYLGAYGTVNSDITDISAVNSGH